VPLEFFVTRRAAREIERIVQWWAVNRPKAPGAVRRDLQAALDLLLVRPGIGTRVTEASSPDVRRFHLDRIRYWVYYRVR
jgi:plasmid stabilization system protein ParE